jgi:hypothetical protein
MQSIIDGYPECHPRQFTWSAHLVSPRQHLRWMGLLTLDFQLVTIRHRQPTWSVHLLLPRQHLRWMELLTLIFWLVVIHHRQLTQNVTIR